MAYFHMEKTHRPDACGQAVESNELSGQSISHEASAPFPHDLSVGMHAPPGTGLPVASLARGLHVSSTPGPITTCRHFLPQGLVWAPVIVIAPPAIKTLLLCAHGAGRGPGGVGFENA